MLDQDERSNAIDLSLEAPFRVGAATIDPVSYEAAFGGSKQRLQPQNLKVLLALVQKRGRLVTRDELISRCWDGRAIGDDVINRAISTLRQFADRAGGFEIETVPRAGYRLIEQGRGRWKRPWIIGAVGLLVLAGAASLVYHFAAGRDVAPESLTVEVLPFETSGGDPTSRAIAFAARDSLSHALSQTRFVVVDPGPDAHQQTSANFVFSADVSSSPASVDITVQMQEPVQHVVIYSQHFSADKKSAWSLPVIVGPQVAGSLGWMAPMLLADHRYPSDTAILADLFQQSGPGDYQRTRRIALASPNSAVAQLALASSVGSSLPFLPVEQRAEALAVGRAAQTRAEMLAPEVGDTQMVWCMLHSRARMIECEERLRSAVRRDPSSPWADYALADRLKDGGLLQEALGFAQHSLAADPFVPAKLALSLRLLEANGRTDDAEGLYRLSDRWWPARGMIVTDRIYGIMDRGDFEALAKFDDELARDHAAEWRDHLQQQLSPIASLLGPVRSRDASAVRRLCPLDQPGSFKRDVCMLAYERIGDTDDAMALAFSIFPDRVGRSAVDEDRLFLALPFVTDTDILTGPSAASLRSDPRYLELARRIGLLAYWQSGRMPDFCRSPHSEPICSSLKVRTSKPSRLPSRNGQ